MNSVERILTALRGGTPDKVPFAFGYIHPKIREGILGETIPDEHHYKVNWSPTFLPGERCTTLEPDESTDVRVARKLGLDALGFQLLTPVMPRLELTAAGTYALKGGLLTPETLSAWKQGLPDVDDPALYREGEAFVQRYRGEFALFCRIRLGFSPTLISMGQQACQGYVKSDPDFVKEVVSTYGQWMKKHIRNLMELGFDFLWSFDDLADHSGPFFTSKELQDIFIPALLPAAQEIKTPWIFHSDGNLFPVLDDLMTLGMSGLHPLEPGAMDLKLLKREYGKKLCLVGNIDIKHTMTDATDEEIRQCIDTCMDTLAHDGSYIISDSNSVPASVNPDNIVKISEHIQKARCVYAANGHTQQ